MVVFPHAKINLGLHVLRLREDGYRDIDSVLVPIPLHDVLEVITDASLQPGEVVMSASGLPVPLDPKGNLCVRAVNAIMAEHPLPGLRIHLHKNIPIGAGLGGGSSDGTFMLKALNALIGLGLSQEQLHRMSASMGSDCPFFLDPHTQIVSGRGEVLRKIGVDLTGWWLLLIAPGVHVSTAEVYANTAVSAMESDLLTALDQPLESWMGTVHNRMEAYVLSAYPAVREAKELLVSKGATYASMSGSGSSVFGLFKEKPALPDLRKGQRAWVMRL